ncbi:MAG: chemotaxis response regulator protein-glutamate methylesterase [Chlamydiales bacterium]|nr:chemotaxis response regulator protein-glutamate methylesterase [Chlamydiales bacterium]
MVRVAIVNDIVMAAEVLKRLILSVPGYEVAWLAYDGHEAVQKAKSDPPDLILMDLIMPGMGGAQATKEIMANSPCAILIVTASVSGNISHVFEAMGHGALDVTAMPVLGNNIDSEGAQKLLQKIRMMHRLIGKEANVEEVATTVAKPVQKEEGVPPLIVFGASTGGPLALSTILSQLPEDFPAAVAIVQHVDSPFVENLVNWLGEQCPLPVRIAREGAVPRAGVVLVAGTSEHMVLTRNLQIHYTMHPKTCPYRPSVDVLFDSVARHWPQPGVGVLLTGMGKDGAQGLKSLKDVGWQTIAQDKESCVVYGMPKAAAEMGAVGTVLPLEAIAPELVRMINPYSTKTARNR